MTTVRPRVRRPARGDVLQELGGHRWWVWSGDSWDVLQGVESFVANLVTNEVALLMSMQDQNPK